MVNTPNWYACLAKVVRVLPIFELVTCLQCCGHNCNRLQWRSSREYETSPLILVFYFPFFFLILVFILIAIGGGLLLGAATLLFVWRMRVKYKREMEKQQKQKYPRVSFTIPSTRMGESPIPLQTNYPQQEQKGLENYLDPEIYRW